MVDVDRRTGAAWSERRADLALLGVAGLWGATFVMVKDALADIGPLTFVAYRFGLAALAMAPLLWPRRRDESAGSPTRLAPADGLGPLLLAGTAAGSCLFAGYAFQTAGLQFTGAGRAGFITGLSVVIVPVVAAVVERQPIGRAVVLGVGLATAGLALLSLGDVVAQPEALDWRVGVGDLLVFGCAWSFALHILVLGRFAPRHGAIPLTFVQIAAVALLGCAAAVTWESPSWGALVAAWPAAAFTGLLCTVVAFAVQTRAQRFTSATHTALIFSTEPVFAAGFAYLLAGERLDGTAIIGCAMILAGMLAVQVAPGTATPSDHAVTAGRKRGRGNPAPDTE